ncbi:Os05g0452500, partial [Oryza sativa Japonica Group]
ELSPQITQSEIRSYSDLNSGPWGATQVTATIRLHTLLHVAFV